jgi:hypothetical protein
MIPAIRAGNYDLSGISKGDATVLPPIRLDTYREKTALVSLLPFIHTGIQAPHGSVLEVNEVTLIDV